MCTPDQDHNDNDIKLQFLYQNTCRQPDMLLDGCKVYPEFQDIILSSTDANSYTADGHAASLSKEIEMNIKKCTVIINSEIPWV